MDECCGDTASYCGDDGRSQWVFTIAWWLPERTHSMSYRVPMGISIDIGFQKGHGRYAPDEPIGRPPAKALAYLDQLTIELVQDPTNPHVQVTPELAWFEFRPVFLSTCR